MEQRKRQVEVQYGDGLMPSIGPFNLYNKKKKKNYPRILK